MKKLKTAVFLCPDMNELSANHHQFLTKNFDAVIQVKHMNESYMQLPNPGLAYMAAIQHQLDLSRSIVIGKNSGIEVSTMVGSLEGKQGIRFVGNAPNCGNVAGELVPDDLYDSIMENDIGMKRVVFRKDESDKDMEFAANSGMLYMDFEKFNNQSWIDKSDLIFYSKTK